jgi:hypothetical protein
MQICKKIIFTVILLVFTFGLATSAYSGPPTPIDLPTNPPHHTDNVGGYFWRYHHDPIVTAGAPNMPVPPGQFSIRFKDNMNGYSWHMEFELEGPAKKGIISPGVLVIKVPGGGWMYDYGSLAAGQTFTIACPAGAGHDFPGIVWEERRVQEIGGWRITYKNNTATPILVDCGISECVDPIRSGCTTCDPNQPDHCILAETPFDFVGDVPIEPDILIEIVREPTGKVPTLTQWGLIILVILVVGSGIWLMIKRRRLKTV